MLGPERARRLWNGALPLLWAMSRLRRKSSARSCTISFTPIPCSARSPASRPREKRCTRAKRSPSILKSSKTRSASAMADGELTQAIKRAPSGGDLDALLIEIRPAMRRLAKSIAKQRCAGDIDDLCQLGLLEATRRFPEWNPAQTPSFMQFVSAYARGVMLNSLIEDARQLAIARTMHHAAQLVLNQIDTGDFLAEPEHVRKARYDEARAASSAAAVVALTRDDPEQQLMSAQQAETLRVAVQSALAALDAVERTLVVEYIIEERSMVDIAAEVGVEYDNARWRLKKALLKVRERLKGVVGAG